jgi:hypothetical protein
VPEAPTYRNALPLNSMLFEYRLESVLGAGGFGLTYLGWVENKKTRDRRAQRQFPLEFAGISAMIRADRRANRH